MSRQKLLDEKAAEILDELVEWVGVKRILGPAEQIVFTLEV